MENVKLSTIKNALQISMINFLIKHRKDVIFAFKKTENGSIAQVCYRGEKHIVFQFDYEYFQQFEDNFTHCYHPDASKGRYDEQESLEKFVEILDPNFSKKNKNPTEKNQKKNSEKTVDFQ